METMEMDFGELRQRSSALGGGLPAAGEDAPPMRRDLTQLYHDALRMAAGGGSTLAAEQAATSDVMSRAQRLLLSTGGFDIEAATREAQQLQGVSDSGAAPAPAATTDLGEFVARVHREVLGRVLLGAQAMARGNTDATLSRALSSEWEHSKAVMLASLGLGPMPNTDQQPLQREGAPIQGTRGGRTLGSPAGAMQRSTGGAGPAGGPEDGGSLPFGPGPGDLAAEASPMDQYAAQFCPVVRDIAAVSQDGSAAVFPASQVSSFPMIRLLASVAEAAWEEEDARRADGNAGGGETPRGGRGAGGNSGGPDVSMHTRMWRLLLEVTRESSPGATRGAFAGTYLGEGTAAAAGGGPMSPEMGITWASGSIAYLEALFRHVLEAAVAENRPIGAETAAAPSLLGTIRQYLSTLLERHRRAAHASRSASLHPGAGVAGPLDVPQWYQAACQAAPLAGGFPLWPQVFLCLRTGGRTEALTLLSDAAASDPSRVPTALRDALGACISVLDAAAAYGGGDKADAAADECAGSSSSVPRAMAAAGTAFASLRDAAAQRAAVGVDPWKAEVLCLIAGAWGDPEHTDDLVLRTSHDWVWHRAWFALTDRLGAVTAPAGQPRTSYSLADLATAVLESGAAHFDPRGTKPYYFAELLLLVGQPEAAVAHLATATARGGATGRSLHDAVHLALALSYYGLLRTVPAHLCSRSSGGYIDACVDRLAAAKSSALRASLPRGAQQVEGSGELLYNLPQPPALQGAYLPPTVALDLPFLLSNYAERVLLLPPGGGRPAAPGGAAAAVAADYLSLVTQLPAREALLASLLLSTQAFNTLVGPLGPSPLGGWAGALDAGAIPSHGSQRCVVPEEELASVLLCAGKVLRDEGQTLSALSLFLRVPQGMGGLGAATDAALVALVRCMEGAGAERDTLRRVALEMLPMFPAARAAEEGGSPGDMLGAGGGSPGDMGQASSPLSARMHGVEVALCLCEMYDALAAGRWGDAVACAERAGIIPQAPSEAAWASVFDSLPAPLKEAFPGVLRAVMAGLAGAFRDARGQAAAATGIPVGRALAAAMEGQDPSASNASVLVLRSLKIKSRTLVTGHSALMRRYISPGLLSELSRADMALQA